MKIVYIHQFFKTPEEPGGTRSYWIARELIDQGHEVIMLTANKKIEGNTMRVGADGITVIYHKGIYDSGTMNLRQRFFSMFGFAFKTLRSAWRIKNVDLVIATSTPLTVGIPAMLLKKLKGIPFVFEVRDLWPEVPIQMGALNNPILRSVAEWLEREIYKNSSHIIALSPGMQQGIVSKNVPESKVSMIPNMSKVDEFWDRPPNVAVARKFDLDMDSFKVIYFGSLNIANAIEYIIEAAILLLKEPYPIEIIFLGEGYSKPLMKKKCIEENISNVKFFDRIPMELLSEVVNLCQASLVTFSNIPILATNSPNKLFDSLSAGKPIIVNSPGWTKDLVTEYDCGMFADPLYPDSLRDVILHLYNHPERVAEMGKNARHLAETKYDKKILCKQFAEIINQQPNV